MHVGGSSTKATCQEVAKAAGPRVPVPLSSVSPHALVRFRSTGPLALVQLRAASPQASLQPGHLAGEERPCLRPVQDNFPKSIEEYLDEYQKFQAGAAASGKRVESAK